MMVHHNLKEMFIMFYVYKAGETGQVGKAPALPKIK